jgi:hypothetical protein
MPMTAVMWRLDLDEDAVLALLEDRLIPWAFDIGSASVKDWLLKRRVS